LLNSGRRQTLVDWIQEIHRVLGTDNPMLSYWLGRAQLQVTPTEGIKTLEHALELFRKNDDRQGRMECLAALLGGAFLGFHSLDAMDPWIDELLVLIEATPEFKSENVELRILGVLCTSLFHVRPWHPLLIPAYRRIEALLPHCSDPGVALASAMGALVVSGLCGDFDRGDRIAVAAEALASQDTASPTEAAWCMAQVGWLRFVEARYEEALDSFAIGCRIAESNGLRAVLWRFTVEWRAIGWSVANATLAKAEAMPTPRSSMAVAMLPLFQSRRALHRGQTEEAAKLAVLSQRAAMRIGSHLQALIFSLTSADVLLAAGRIEDARAHLLHSHGLIDKAPVYRCFRAAQVLMEARCSQLSGNRALALTQLREVMLRAGEQNGRYYLRFCDQAMPPLFQLAFEEGVEVDAVKDLIRMFRLKPPLDARDNWPWPVRILTLGRFEVQINGDKLEFSHKLPRKTLLLLKAIVALGARDVPEQVLWDTLWADEEGDAARNALSITVLRLRKLLGSNDAVIHQGGKVLLDPAICWVDAWAFEARLANVGPDSHKILELYGGHFLPEDEGESWSVAPRERLRGKFIDALSGHGGTLEAQGDLPGAIQFYLRGIDADPIVESFYLGLMRCYERLGKRTEALSVYRRLKHTLSVVLGVPPSEATQRLFQDMLHRQSVDGETRADESAGNGAPAKKSGIVTQMPQHRAR
jgi:LuxR family transcriptional regulator, maltose regulon positive regulatory protein